jgi:hypothetical protein
MGLPPDEYSAYQYASKQPEPAVRAADLEDFLGRYPRTTIKKIALNLLVDAYRQVNDPESNDPAKELDAATRLLEVDPDNLKAIFLLVYLGKIDCKRAVDPRTGELKDAQPCENAALLAQKGLAVAKPSDTPEAAWSQTIDAAYPAFHSAIALNYVLAKMDYASAIQEYTAELTFYSPNDCNNPGPCLEDTLQLAQAYTKPGRARDEVKSIWFYARAWNFAPQEFKAQIEQQLDYYYTQRRGTLEGEVNIRAQIEDIKRQAAGSVSPPAGFAIEKATSQPGVTYSGKVAQPGSATYWSSTAHSGSSTCCSAEYRTCPSCTGSLAIARPDVIPTPRTPETRYVPGAYTSAIAASARSETSLVVAGNNAALPANVHPVYTIPEGSATRKVHENGAVVPIRFGRLDQQGAAAVIQQVNKARSSMKGINRIPLPAGNVIAQTNGSLTITPTPGRFIQVRADGTVSSVRSLPVQTNSSLIEGKQQAILFDRRGKIAEVHNPSLDIYHGPHGIRTFVARRPDGKILVGTGPHSGYLEDTFSTGGVSYLRRSYLAGHSRSVRIYRAYDDRGQRSYRYIPARRYSTEFYTWTRMPWFPPVIYKWFPNPPRWLNAYDHYYTTQLANLNVRDWITDYIFIGIFDDASEMDGEDSGSGANAPSSQDSGDGDPVYADADSPVTPELRQAIADEVQEQLNEEAAETDASDQGPQEPNPAEEWTPSRYFVAENPIQAATEDGHTCLLDAGNVLRFESAPSWPPHAKLTVVASRRSDCPVDAKVNLPLDQLEEMENSIRARLADGLQTLYTQQNQNGLPAMPDSVTPVPQALYAASADDNNLQTLLTEQQKAAAQAETDARNFAEAELASGGQQ